MRRILAVLVGLAAAPAAHADSDVEHPRYSVVASEGDFEIRDYAPQIVAETTTSGARDAAIRAGFRRLAAYIFGGNAPRQKVPMTAPFVQEKDGGAGEKIAMTAPVAQTRADDGWRVRFVMPAQYTMATLPRPNDPEVRLLEIPGKRMAVVRFSGLAGDADLAGNESKLLEHLSKQGLAPRGSPHYAFYDPPWTLPWNRRNEVMVEVGRK